MDDQRSAHLVRAAHLAAEHSDSLAASSVLHTALAGLLDRGMPPAEVAAAAGFADQAHLSRRFKRIVGVPPGAYQRAHGGAGPQ